MMDARTRRIALSVLGIGASALFLWLAVRRTDFNAIGDSLSSANLYPAVPFLAVLFSFYWLKSIRWRDLLPRKAGVQARKLFPIVMIGYAGTAILPLQMGELVRTWLCAKRFSIPIATVFGSVAIERLFDLLTVLALLAVVIVSGSVIPDVFVTVGYVVGLLCLAAIAVSFMFIIRKDATLNWIGGLVSWIPGEIASVLLAQIRKLADSLESLQNPANALRIAANSVVQWLLMGVCLAISLYALDISIPPVGVMLLLVATVLGVSLPTSPGYVGNIQLAFSLALTPYDVDPADAFAASVFYHILAYSAVVTVGFFYAHQFGLGFSKLKHAAEDESTKTTI